MQKIVFLLLFFSSLCFSAYIHGQIYGPDLSILKGAVVEINTIPKQRMVAVDGVYSFNIDKGNYTLVATYNEEQISYVLRENISVKNNENFTYDLILFETNDTDQMYFFKQEEDTNFDLILFLLIALVFVAGLVLFKIKKSKSKIELDEELISMLDHLHKAGGRINQKELRKFYPFSEAKASLLISELVDMKLIKKIKKGRANILILTRSGKNTYEKYKHK